MSKRSYATPNGETAIVWNDETNVWELLIGGVLVASYYDEDVLDITKMFNAWKDNQMASLDREV
jgi:hypothetical protein